MTASLMKKKNSYFSRAKNKSYSTPQNRNTLVQSLERPCYVGHLLGAVY